MPSLPQRVQIANIQSGAKDTSMVLVGPGEAGPGSMGTVGDWVTVNHIGPFDGVTVQPSTGEVLPVLMKGDRVHVSGTMTFTRPMFGDRWHQLAGGSPVFTPWDFSWDDDEDHNPGVVFVQIQRQLDITKPTDPSGSTNGPLRPWPRNILHYEHHKDVGLGSTDLLTTSGPQAKWYQVQAKAASNTGAPDQRALHVGDGMEFAIAVYRDLRNL